MSLFVIPQNDSNGNKISGDETSGLEDEYFSGHENISNYAYHQKFNNKEPVLKSNSTDDDLSSEYTDPEDSSAPTELLAEVRNYFDRPVSF